MPPYSDEKLRAAWQAQLVQRQRDFASEAIAEARQRQRPLYELFARMEREEDRRAREWREETIRRNGLAALMGGRR